MRNELTGKIDEKSFVLAGDVGGTKTNLGLFSAGDECIEEQVIETYPSQKASCLEEIVARFLDKHKCPITSCCIGIAGPVMNGRVKTTNLPWEVSEKDLEDRFCFEKAIIVNDLVAMAYSLAVLKKEDLFPLNNAESQEGENCVLIAPGTGLGMSLVPWINGRYQPQPSEGGHVDFGPRNEEEISLCRYLRKRFGRVSYERLVSGSGLVNIYTWLKETGGTVEQGWLTEELRNNDSARVISENGMTGKDRQCEKALDLFVSIFGSIAGNLALTGMATGGVYLGGGIVPKIKQKLLKGGFVSSFMHKGRYRQFMENVPVNIVLNDKSALIGAACHASEYERWKKA